MHYGRGLQEAKVCVAEIEAQNTINATKISNFTKYHSISFHNDHMTMWRYYDIGKGVRFDYKGVQFKSGLRLINPFSKTCKETINKCSKKVKNDHSKLDFIFCSELTCSFTTNEEAELEKHMLVGDHLVPKENKVMDKVKKSFISKIKGTSAACASMRMDKEQYADVGMDEACKNCPLFSLFTMTGWALPIRSNFRFSYKQKKNCYTTVLWKVK